ncbi:disease resistance protein RGA2-like [Silene latifolia]|uniref:disease resistance protein RGA2-like n=1 Tax=Silene latifolia TaxID=37657 RepID=UPI003D77EAD8
MADSNTNEFDERVCHVSYNLAEDESSLKVPSSLFKIKQLKSFLVPFPSDIRPSYKKQFRLFPLNDKSIFRIQSLRALRMCGLGINKLPRSIELPEDINKLVALRHLHLFGCDKLSHMPKGLRRLTGLETLDRFVVGKPSNSATPYGCKAKLACDLSDLGYLDNLKGMLTIILVDRSKDIVSKPKPQIEQKEITGLIMIFRESRLEDEMVLENLKPGANLELLSIKDYGGKRLPSWMREGIHCTLPNLHNLRLERLDKVEYIEDGSSSKSNMIVSTPLFPFLKNLTLMDIPRLKGWWSMTESAQDQSQNQLLKRMPAFPKREWVEMDMELVISLAQVFLSRLSSLHILFVLGKTKEVEEQRCGPSNVGVKQRQPVILLKNYLPMLRNLVLCNSQKEYLPEEFRGMTSLKFLEIDNYEALEAFPELIDTLTSLESLTIYNCPRLKSLPAEISNLSNLKSLRLERCSRELAERCQSPSGEDWPKIQHIPNITIQPDNPLKMGRMNRINQVNKSGGT